MNEFTLQTPTQEAGLATAMEVVYQWNYDAEVEELRNLYVKAAEAQWIGGRDIEWERPIDLLKFSTTPLGAGIPMEKTSYWRSLPQDTVVELTRRTAAFRLSQFLHGEQGALMVAAQLVNAVPHTDAKFYAATQTMDEARHAELYSRFLHDKIGLIYPINSQLQALLNDTLNDSRWDMPYLGMQVLIEGLALAAFGVLRDLTTKPLPRQILAYVMQDEARHVAFGRMALRDYYGELSATELREREDFVIEGCYLMKDRIRGVEMWENFGFTRAEIDPIIDQSEFSQMFRKLLFSRIVPCVRDIGLWGPRLQQAYADMGVLQMSAQDLDTLMGADEELADKLDAQRFAAEEAMRKTEVHEAIAHGSGAIVEP